MTSEKQPAATGASQIAASPAFEAFYEATSARAFSIALRLAGEEGPAVAACEAAYLDAWQRGQEFLADRSSAEAWLFERIRLRAFGLVWPDEAADRSAPAAAAYTDAEAIRAGLLGLDALGRRTIELAYFGGLGVPAIAELLSESQQRVREAMRAALLQLGSVTRHRGENDR